VAWNGEACDLKWLWRLTQAPNSRYSLPENIKFFIDPYRVIEKYKSCGFNKTKSKIEALSNNKVGWRDGITVQRRVRG
jgi:hypothetical protein